MSRRNGEVIGKMDISNQTLMRFGVVVILIFIAWMAFMIIRKLKGDVINKEDVYEYFRK